MMTDDERRKIAQKLRDDAKSGALPYSDFLGAVAYDVGVEKEHAAVLHRLADLIEPSCDRDALLALADEADRSATELLKANDLDSNRKRRSMRREHAQDLMAMSSRIRKALGVEDYASHDN